MIAVRTVKPGAAGWAAAWRRTRGPLGLAADSADSADRLRPGPVPRLLQHLDQLPPRRPRKSERCVSRALVGFAELPARLQRFCLQVSGAQLGGGRHDRCLLRGLDHLVVVLGLLAALMLNRSFRARGLARGSSCFRTSRPVVSVAFVWRWLLDPRPSGVFNDVLTSTGRCIDAHGLSGTRAAWPSGWSSCFRAGATSRSPC